MNAHIVKAHTTTVDVRHEEGRVLVIHNGVLLWDMPYQAALDVARAIHVKAKQAEEHVKALEIIADEAVLIRAGVPLSLTANKTIWNEAKHMAETDSALRRYIPTHGIRSGERFGVPTIIQSPPPRKE